MKEVVIPMNSWSKARLRTHKICTSRTKTYGNIGDIFVVDGKIFQIDGIVTLPTQIIISHLYYPEGAESPKELEKVFKSIFRGNKLPQFLYTHFFSKVEAVPCSNGGKHTVNDVAKEHQYCIKCGIAGRFIHEGNLQKMSPSNQKQ